MMPWTLPCLSSHVSFRRCLSCNSRMRYDKLYPPKKNTALDGNGQLRGVQLQTPPCLHKPQEQIEGVVGLKNPFFALDTLWNFSTSDTLLTRCYWQCLGSYEKSYPCTQLQVTPDWNFTSAWQWRFTHSHVINLFVAAGNELKLRWRRTKKFARDQTSNNGGKIACCETIVRFWHPPKHEKHGAFTSENTGSGDSSWKGTQSTELNKEKEIAREFKGHRTEVK